jgi:hypothetical protein
VVASTALSETFAPPARACKLFGRLSSVVIASDSARLYACARCRCHVVICRRCDRGNRYCRPCAPIAFRESRRRAGAAYQQTERGKANHRVRQQLYMLGLDEEKMTHQGPQGGSATSPCAPQDAERFSASAKEASDVHPNPSPCHSPAQHGAACTDGDDRPRCDYCGQRCSAFLRTDKLRFAASSSQPRQGRDRTVPGHRRRMQRQADRRAPWAVPRGGPARAPARAPPAPRWR